MHAMTQIRIFQCWGFPHVSTETMCEAEMRMRCPWECIIHGIAWTAVEDPRNRHRIWHGSTTSPRSVWQLIIETQWNVGMSTKIIAIHT